MKKTIPLLLLFLSAQLHAQTTDIVINDKKVDQLNFNMSVRKAKTLLGNDYRIKEKRGSTCHYNFSTYDVIKTLNYTKTGVKLQFNKTSATKTKSRFKKCKLSYISIKDSSLITVNNISLFSDTTKVTNTFGRNFTFKESWFRDQKEYNMMYGNEGIWFVLDTNMRVREITIDSKKIIYHKPKEDN